jgi:hypothetical protein
MPLVLGTSFVRTAYPPVRNLGILYKSAALLTPNPNDLKPNTHSMSSQMVSLESSNRATLVKVGTGQAFLSIQRISRKEGTNEPKNLFHPFFDTFSTGFQHLFAFFDISLVFFVLASKICQLLITAEACCHFAPPRATCVTCAVKKEACCHVAPPKKGWGEGYKPNPKGILSQCRYTDTKIFPRPKFSRKIPIFFKPCQTEACCHFAPPKKACCHFAPLNSLSQRSVRERVGVRAACCHFAPPTVQQKRAKNYCATPLQLPQMLHNGWA